MIDAFKQEMSLRGFYDMALIHFSFEDFSDPMNLCFVTWCECRGTTVNTNYMSLHCHTNNNMSSWKI